jgi:hypothetical protein
MSSTGLIDINANNINSDIIDVNQKLTVNNIDILDLINNNVNDISGNINDISGNINDISGNLNDLWDTVIDLSDNVTQIKITNELQGSAITELQTLTGGHTAQIEANSGAIIELTAQTEANSVAIAATITATAVGDIVTGLVDTIDSKVPSSYFGSGNVGIYGLLNAKFISVVYNVDHFEDSNFVFVSNKVLSLKDPYKSLPTSKNNYFTCVSPLIKNDNTNQITIDLSAYPLKTYVDGSLNTINTNKQNYLNCISPLIKNDISNNISIDLSGYLLKSNFDLSYNYLNNNKQFKFTCISPLIKNDISNNISIDLSGYNIGRIKGNNLILNEGNIDSSGNSLICYYNNPGVYFTDNSFNSFFNISSALNANGALLIQPFVTVYNRMFKNGANTALKFSTYGGSNSGVNSSSYILLDSGGDPTPGANIGNIKFNISTNAEGEKDRLVITPTTSIFYNNVGIGKSPSVALDISGHLNVSQNIYTQVVQPFNTGSAAAINIRSITSGNVNLVSETGNIVLNTNSTNRFLINSNGLIYAYNNFDVSGNLKTSGSIDS